MLKILGVCGSMRENSNSLKAVRAVLAAAELRGAQTRVLDLRQSDLPMYRARAERTHHAGRNDADQAVQWAQALLLITPDYHGSMSGAMKNFLDHYLIEFSGKLFGYGCVSHEKGLTVMDQMRTAIRQCYGWSMPYGISINAGDAFDERGAIQNEALKTRAQMLARDLTVYGSILRDQFESDLNGDDGDTFAAFYRK